MKIPYYPGCTLNTVAKGFDESARESSALLGIEFDELKNWNCCGATFPLSPDNLIALSAPAKVLSNARKQGDTLTTLCSVCYNVLKRTNKVIKGDKVRRGVINGFMGDDYDGGVSILHFLEVLRDMVGFDAVKKAVKNPLKGIKAGAYYGCMLLRPFEDAGIDDAEEPRVLEDLLSAIGLEPVRFPLRIECCGAHLAVNKEDIVLRLSGNVLSSAVNSGAELIVTSCPLCQYNLEKSQARLVSEMPGYAGVPIVYFTQVLGLALGQDIARLGFDRNKWDISPVLKGKGILA
ncbi:MAG: CoB--CoM heterodisulfide reductase iron-sulfur subunit B family protein [Deltaproteobacteria bacterium]